MVDFVIIGAMKSGTSTLHGWLSESSGVSMCSLKEPSFFSRDDLWARGLDWYDGLYPHDLDQAGRRGEASVSYTDPRYAETTAERLATVAPEVRIIYLLRHPVDRARSHYRHQVQRGRETRTLVPALRDREALYLAQSEYWTCLSPFIGRFGRDQILVVRLEDLTGPSESAWHGILDHLRLERMPRPTSIRNVTAEKSRYTWFMRWLWEHNLLPSGSWIPASIRRLGRRLLLRDDAVYEALIEGSAGPIPDELLAPVWDDVGRLEEWLEVEAPMWNRP